MKNLLSPSSVPGVDAGDMASKQDEALALINFCDNSDDLVVKGQMLH